MTSHHSIPMWWEWNMNPNIIMLMWFTLYANTNDITLGMHDMHTCMVKIPMYFWHTLIVIKLVSVCTQAELTTLGNIMASHYFQVGVLNYPPICKWLKRVLVVYGTQ